jgi:hypothetical protein
MGHPPWWHRKTMLLLLPNLVVEKKLSWKGMKDGNAGKSIDTTIVDSIDPGR